MKIDLLGQTVDFEQQMRLLDQLDCEESLYSFLQSAWQYIDASPFTPGWPLEAVCEHLEAVARGDIKRLIINIPPRCGKSSIVSACYPAWTWAQSRRGPTSGPGVQILCASYAQNLVVRDSVKCRRLIQSPFYQRLFGDRFKLTGDQNTKTRFSNDQGGERLITSVDSGVTGEGGNIIIVDDANAANEAFSEATIARTIEWWDGTMSTRLNNLKTGAYVIIQQRLAEDDLTGHILGKDTEGEWTLLCLPMRYEWRRHCVTGIGWQDPRGLDDEGNPLVLLDDDSTPTNATRYPRDPDAEFLLTEEREGSLLWEERFGEKEVDNLERELGPTKAAGQLQQYPEPAGGNVIKADWWKFWDRAAYPPLDYVCACLDTAYGLKQENDYSALTVWGIFSTNPKAHATKVVSRAGRLVESNDGETRNYGVARPCAILLFAWQKRLPLHELVKLVAQTCDGGNHLDDSGKRIFSVKVDRLLIENKAAGISVAQEMRRLFQDAPFSTQLVDPKAIDKLSRLYSVQHIFAEGMVFAPDKSWADDVIKQVSSFPKGKHDDFVDTVSMALRHLRDVGMLTRTEEAIREHEDAMRFDSNDEKPLYEV